jgi:hypothetical protein
MDTRPTTTRRKVAELGHVGIEPPADELMGASRASVEEYGASGFTEESYERWTRDQAGVASPVMGTEAAS